MTALKICSWVQSDGSSEFRAITPSTCIQPNINRGRCVPVISNSSCWGYLPSLASGAQETEAKMTGHNEKESSIGATPLGSEKVYSQRKLLWCNTKGLSERWSCLQRKEWCLRPVLKQRCCCSSALLCPCHFNHQPVEALNEYILQMILFTRNPVKDVLTWKCFWLLQCFLKLFLSWMLIFLAAVWNQIQPLESILCCFMQVRTNSKNGTKKKGCILLLEKKKKGTEEYET